MELIPNADAIIGQINRAGYHVSGFQMYEGDCDSVHYGNDVWNLTARKYPESICSVCGSSCRNKEFNASNPSFIKSLKLLLTQIENMTNEH